MMNTDQPVIRWTHVSGGDESCGSLALDGCAFSLESAADPAVRLPILFIRAGTQQDFTISSQRAQAPLLLNGLLVRQAQLRHGDVIEYGHTELRYESPLPPMPDPPTMTVRSVMGALVCALLLFFILLPFLSRVALSGVGSGMGQGSGNGTGAGSGQSGSGQGAGSGAGSSNSGSTSGAGATDGSGGSGVTAGAAPGQSGASNPSSAASQNQAAGNSTSPAASKVTVKAPETPTPGVAQSQTPIPVPVPNPGTTVQSAPVAQQVEALGNLRSMQSAGRSTPFSGGNYFVGGGNAKKVVYVVDYSGSMQGSKHDNSRQNLVAALEQLNPTHAMNTDRRFYVFFFNDKFEAQPGTRGLMPATNSNLQDARNWINSLQTSGGTNPVPAVQEALDMEPEEIWILSDGNFSESAVDAIRVANQKVKASIHTIGINADAPTLKRIAEENQGMFRYVQLP